MESITVYSREKFMTFEVVRNPNVAEINIGIYNPDDHGGKYEQCRGKPVRLLGFTADSGLTDYEILELGYEHYKNFVQEVNRIMESDGNMVT